MISLFVQTKGAEELSQIEVLGDILSYLAPLWMAAGVWQ